MKQQKIFRGVKILIPPKQTWDISIPIQKFFLLKHFEISIPTPLSPTNFGKIGVPQGCGWDATMETKAFKYVIRG